MRPETASGAVSRPCGEFSTDAKAAPQSVVGVRSGMVTKLAATHEGAAGFICCTWEPAVISDYTGAESIALFAYALQATHGVHS